MDWKKAKRDRAFKEISGELKVLRLDNQTLKEDIKSLMEKNAELKRIRGEQWEVLDSIHEPHPQPEICKACMVLGRK